MSFLGSHLAKASLFLRYIVNNVRNRHCTTKKNNNNTCTIWYHISKCAIWDKVIREYHTIVDFAVILASIVFFVIVDSVLGFISITWCLSHLLTKCQVQMTAQTGNKRNMLSIWGISILYFAIKTPVSKIRPILRCHSLLHWLYKRYGFCNIEDPSDAIDPMDPIRSIHRIHWCISHISNLPILCALYFFLVHTSN